MGVPQITIYEERGDGTFHKTSEQALRQLREYIVGLSPSIGDLVSNRLERSERPWHSPTARLKDGRPRSYYAFLRECVRRHRLVVMTTPALSGRILRFSMHNLILKPGMSTQVIHLMAEKYLEALDISQQPPEPGERPLPEPPAKAAAPAPKEAPAERRNVRELNPRLLRILRE